MRPEQSYKKQIKTNYEAQLLINQIINDEIKKNQLRKVHKKQPKSTDQTCDLSHETRITLQNANRDKL
jgi:hypothetical protein